MKEIVVISGKGGTGKTSITASFAYLGGGDIVTADCDVDAADMHLLLKPDFAQSGDFYSGFTAVIDQDKCSSCGRCFEICRFNAINSSGGKYSVNITDCEGCGYCEKICSSDAVTMEERNVGKWFVSRTKVNSKMVHARLSIGAENSGKLVAKVKNEAKRIAEDTGTSVVLVDGSPGIGCPVVSSLSGADFAVLVTEPTVSGLHDLKRVYQVVRKFGIKAGCIINKSDLNPDVTDDIKRFLKSENIVHIASLPYDEDFTLSMTGGKTVVEYKEGRLKKEIEKSWSKIKKSVGIKEEK